MWVILIIPAGTIKFWEAWILWLVIVSNILVFGSYIFIFFVFKGNAYASTVIQVENEQHVITTGPYSIIRHPMYLGMVIMSLFMSLALGSYFSLIPMLFIIPIILFRIKNEEEILLRDLKGYKEYYFSLDCVVT